MAESERWTFDNETMAIEYRGFQVGSLRDQWDTESAETPDGDEFDKEMQRLGEKIVAALNGCCVTYEEYEKSLREVQRGE